MAIYEYVCLDCGRKFEIFWKGQTIGRTEEILTYGKKKISSAECPDCGATAPKVFSTFNFQFSPFLDELCKGTII